MVAHVCQFFKECSSENNIYNRVFLIVEAPVLLRFNPSSSLCPD